MKKIRIGTRGSALARKQTQLVINALHAAYPDCRIETVILRTEGDRILDKSLVEFGGKGVFVTEFEEALIKGRIDLAVHSAKDMPMELAGGLKICGVLPREDVRDVLVTRKDNGWKKIGTSSLRRQYQLEQLYHGVECAPIRGNVPTRLDKLRAGEFDGVILAAAGLKRLGLLEEKDLEYRYFSIEEMLPAGGQGIIAVEGRQKDPIADMVQCISDADAIMQLQTEQEVLRLLGAGCHEAVGVTTKLTEDNISVRIMKEKEGRLYYTQGEASVTDWLQLAGTQVEKLIHMLQEE